MLRKENEKNEQIYPEKEEKDMRKSHYVAACDLRGTAGAGG